MYIYEIVCFSYLVSAFVEVIRHLYLSLTMYIIGVMFPIYNLLTTKGFMCHPNEWHMNPLAATGKLSDSLCIARHKLWYFKGYDTAASTLSVRRPSLYVRI